MTDLIGAGGILAAGLVIYILWLRERAARKEARAQEARVKHLERALEDVQTADDKLDDPDERERLRNKIGVE